MSVLLVGSVLRSIKLIRTTRRSARPSSSGTCIAVRRGHHLRRMVGSLLLVLVQMLALVLPRVAAVVGRNMSLRTQSVNNLAPSPASPLTNATSNSSTHLQPPPSSHSVSLQSNNCNTQQTPRALPMAMQRIAWNKSKARPKSHQLLHTVPCSKSPIGHPVQWIVLAKIFQ